MNNNIKVVYRPELILSFHRDSSKLIREGCQKINGFDYVRFVRWNKHRRAFVLEALVLYQSELDKELIKNE
jgi:hypothetical protein